MSAYTPDVVLPSPQRRIRHITSFQVRNLTPFPARDALAQTLTQPGHTTSPLPHQPADDIELTLSSRRRRRSAGSVSIVLNMDADDEGGPSATGSRRHKRTSSRGSSQTPRNATAASGTSSIRHQRVRTGTKASAVHAPPSQNENMVSPGDWDGLPAGGQFITYSQRALEKIVSSRLVQSFITLTLPPSEASGTSLNSQPSSPSISPRATAVGSVRKGKDVTVKRATSASAVNPPRRPSTSTSTSTPVTPPSQTKRGRFSASPSPNPSSLRHGSTPGSRTSASSSNVPNFPSPPPTPPPRSPPSHPLTPSTLLSHVGNSHEERSPTTPFYISSLHPPSTNPKFSHLDPEREFAPWADLSCSHFKVTIWGGVHQDAAMNLERVRDSAKGKGKTPASSGNPNELIWKILEEWFVDLDEMEPLSIDINSHPLPSNTLLLTVSSGETFRISPISSNFPSRAPSPSRLEYNSDGEVDEIRRLRRELEESENQRRERETLEKSRRETRMKRSACWQDLVKVVNLQTCIIDTKESLEEIVRNCNLLVEGDGYNAAPREVSEREERLRSLSSEREQVLQDSMRAKDTVETRRNALKLRRDTLKAARAMLEEDFRDYALHTQKVDFERQQHEALVTTLSLLRTTLLQTVSFIFPIEPHSAPDLLFVILGAPLPVPLSGSDPAPPFSLSSQPEVTEDNTATALGYVAQVLQLISAYLGKSLIYPVTCCGSRSVIKDPISAMVGPRMFPLYSKGVETYRFEYGVFLLNKDIEMLTIDRNLRAMDMRHTLPNLKNLLLTLTTGENIQQIRRIGSTTSVTIPSGLQSPRAVSPLPLDNSQSETQHEGAHLKAAGTTASRKPAPFLSPLAAILRARYPSSAGKPTVRVVAETPEPTLGGESGTAACAAIQNLPSDDSPSQEGEESKATLKAYSGTRPSVSSHNGSFEKLAKSDDPPTPHSPPLANAT